VLASNGAKGVVEALLPELQRAAGERIECAFDSSARLAERIDSGERFDVAIVTTDLMTALAARGRIAAGSGVPFARSGIGVGGRARTNRPDISTPAAIKDALLNARGIVYAEDGASRPRIAAMFESLGIAADLKPKTLLERGSIRATARVVAGDADFVITLISEIVPVAGLQLVGPLPPEFQAYVSLSAGVGAEARNAAAASTLLAFLNNPAADATLKANGMERPVSPLTRR
jgi:molybdate transport system substrate-binding protein